MLMFSSVYVTPDPEIELVRTRVCGGNIMPPLVVIPEDCVDEVDVDIEDDPDALVSAVVVVVVVVVVVAV